MVLKPNSLRLLWKLFRPHTLTASFVPVLIGTTLAWKATRHLHWRLFGAMLLASVLIQAATNMFNEYFDYRRGLDTAESVGIAGAITRDGVRPKVILRTAVATLAVAAPPGFYICAHSSWWLAPIGAVSMLVGYLYTAGPFPISATSWGELFAGGFMGSGIVLLSCFIQQRAIHLHELLVSIPCAVLIGAILTSNNIRDMDSDRRNGRHTLAIRLGHRRAVWFLSSSLLLADFWIILLALLHIESPWVLLALGSLWPEVLAVREFRGERTPTEMLKGMQRVAQANTVFGILLVIGLLVSAY